MNLGHHYFGLSLDFRPLLPDVDRILGDLFEGPRQDRHNLVQQLYPPPFEELSRYSPTTADHDRHEERPEEAVEVIRKFLGGHG